MIEKTDTVKQDNFFGKDENIKYLLDKNKMGESIKLILYQEMKTDIKSLNIAEVKKNSIIIKLDEESFKTFQDNSSQLIILDEDQRVYFEVEAKIFCEQDHTLVLNDIKKLDIQPLLNRKYPRARIANNSFIRIISGDKNISGTLIDISEGGIGVLSLNKSDIKKGEDVTVYILYEDKENSLSLNFKSQGILASIIGKERAFRYGIRLNLSDEKRELVNNLVETLNQKF